MMNISALFKQLLALNLPHPLEWVNHYDAILITGPTASGKSSLSLHLADYLLNQANLKTGIISVDSALVYKTMDIGTAKPTLEEQAQVPHYLLNLIEPHQTYSVAQFLNDAKTALNTCQNNQQFPILVGGTMMYVHALFSGLSELPKVEAHYRQTLIERAKQLGWAYLYEELKILDPITAAHIASNDAQRIERALSVFQSTGIPLSTWIAKAKTTPPLLSYPNQTININNNINHITYRCLHLSLEPEKMILWQRIEHRFDTMLAQGFLGEVASLMQRGDLSLEMPSMRCVGYRQAWEYLNNTTTKINNKDYQVFREKGIIATRQLAKRQMTWLRSMPHRLVLNT